MSDVIDRLAKEVEIAAEIVDDKSKKIERLKKLVKIAYEEGHIDGYWRGSVKVEWEHSNTIKALEGE